MNNKAPDSTSPPSQKSPGGNPLQYLHPDSIYDEPYQEKTLDLSSYASLSSPARITETTDHCTTLSDGRRLVRIESPGEGIIRIRFSLPGATIAPSTTERLNLVHLDGMAPHPLSCRQEQESWVFSSNSVTLKLDPKTWDIAISDGAGRSLWQTVEGGMRFSSEDPDYSGQKFFCRSILGEDEHIFGFGARVSPPDRRGGSADIFSVKTGKVSGDYGGFPLPFFLSTRGYGIFLNNPWPHVYFDMGRAEPDRWFLQAPGGDCDIFFIAGPAFPQIIRRFTEITGRNPVVPRWMLGLWCSSLTFKSAEQALIDAGRLRTEGYPCDVFVFDGPWRGGKNFAAIYQQKQEYPSNDMEWHPDFGSGPEMIRDLKAKGIHTALHLNSRNFRPGTAAEGIAKGLLRQQGNEVIPRLLDKNADDYYQSLVAPRIQEGVDVWWTDHSDRVSGELQPGLPSRNLFGPLWNRLLAESMTVQGKTQDLSLSRGGGIGSQKYAIPWPGDTRCGMDALADDIWFMINGGLSGFTLTSADLGGFVPRGNPLKDYPSQEAVLAEMFDDENIARRVCHCLLFTPIPRIHNNWATIPKFPWNCSERIRPLYKQALIERYRLTPYIYSYLLESSRTGEPLLRPLVYHHPDDKEAPSWQTQFYLGDSLLIAPVTEPCIERWPVYLPAGRWTHLWSGRHYEGKQLVEIPAPLYEMSGLPVFVRDGAILVRQPASGFLEDRIPETLEFDIYPSERSVFELRESPEHSCNIRVELCGRNVGISVESNAGIARTFLMNVHDPASEGKVIQRKFVLPPSVGKEFVVALDQ